MVNSMMSPQFILRIAGYVALGVSVLLAFLSVQYFFSHDIKGVMDDLSGKSRARGGTVRTGLGSRPSGHSRRAPSGSKKKNASSAPMPMPTTGSAAPDFSTGVQDDVDTVLDTALRSVNNYVDDGKSYKKEAIDEIGTTLEAGVAYPKKDGRTMSATLEAPTLVEADFASEAGAFRMVRRVVLIHSREVIAAR